MKTPHQTVVKVQSQASDTRRFFYNWSLYETCNFGSRAFAQSQPHGWLVLNISRWIVHAVFLYLTCPTDPIGFRMQMSHLMHLLSVALLPCAYCVLVTYVY